MSGKEPTLEGFKTTGLYKFVRHPIMLGFIIAFYNIRKGNLRVSAIEIVKVRGAEHKKKIVPFTLTKGKGMMVFPTEEVFAE